MRVQFSVENTGELTGPARDTIRTASYANSMRVLLIVAGWQPYGCFSPFWRWPC